MIRKYAKVSLCLALTISLMVGSTTIAYAFNESAPVTLTIDDAVSMAVEKSAQLRDLESSQIQVEDGARKLRQNAQKITFLLEDYYEFADMYRSGDYDKFVDMSQSSLMRSMTNAITAQFNPFLSEAQRERAVKEEEFITYLFIFGNGEPELSSEDKLNQYVKNQVLLDMQADMTIDQFENTKKMVQYGTEEAIKNLYNTALYVEDMLLLQEELLKVKEETFKNNSEEYKQGLISKIEFENAELEYTKQVKEVDKFKRQVDNAILALMSQSGIDVDKELSIVDVISGQQFVFFDKAEEYYNIAIDSNPSIQNKIMDVNLLNKEYELMLKYLDQDDYQTDQVEVEKKLAKETMDFERLKDELRANINMSLDHIQLLKIKVEESKLNSEVSQNTSNKITAMYDQGLVKASDLDQAKIGYVNAKIAELDAQRDYERSLVKFDALINKGVAYEQ